MHQVMDANTSRMIHVNNKNSASTFKVFKKKHAVLLDLKHACIYEQKVTDE